MEFFFLVVIAVVLVILALIIKLWFRFRGKHGYCYQRKEFFMTRAEHECYDALCVAVGERYHVFPQVHLPCIADYKVVGQKWSHAFFHISQKSVDFVLCDKAYISPKLAIELDDRSHERPDRQIRDREVERILAEAGLPLLRLKNHSSFNPSELSQKIQELILK